MTKTYETKISKGKTIKLNLLPAISTGIPVARRLFNIVAPIVGGTLDGIKHDDFIHGAPKTFSELALTLCNQLGEADVSSLIFTLLEGMEVDGKKVDLDEYFSANYDEMIEILEVALKENFSSFFTGSGMKQRFLQAVGMILEAPTKIRSSEE